MSRALWRLSARELADSLDANDVRPDDVIDLALQRAEIFDRSLNIFSHIDADGARRAADSSRKRQQQRRRISPLDGIPVTVKDNLFVAGLPAKWGSRVFASHVAPCDDIVVERLRAAGAIILGKTATPEFALGLVTTSPITGTTRNPWNTEMTTGGSSGGAMAALATGIAPLAIGTDAGGSIRMPASYTNQVGLRPSNGRVPRRFGFATTAHDFQSIGLAARTVADVLLLYDAVAGPDLRDPQSTHVPQPRDDAQPRIGVLTRLGLQPVEHDVLEAVETAAEALCRLDYEVTTVSAPFDATALRDIWRVITAASVARIVQQHGKGDEENLTVPMRALLEAGRGTTASDLVMALDALVGFRSQVSEQWGRYDILLSPTAPAPAWPAALPHPETIDGRASPGETMGNYCGWVNAVGFPAISVPMSFHPDGRPIGVQLIAQFGHERRLLSVAEALYSVSQGRERWPPSLDC